MEDKISGTIPLMITKECECLSHNRYDGMTQEELYTGLANGRFTDEAFEILFKRLRHLVINTAQWYMNPLSMDENDMCQEAMILLWKLIMKGNYEPALCKFTTFFVKCWKRRLDSLWEKYILKNPVPLNYKWDWHFAEPLGDSVFQWSDAAVIIRKRKYIQNKRWLQKKEMQNNVKGTA